MRAHGALRVAVYLLVVGSAPRTVLAQERPTPGVHAVIERFRSAMETWLDPAERARLDAVDVSDTASGDGALLVRIATDRGIREWAALAFERATERRIAQQLRSLPPLTDGEALQRLRRAPAVVRALRDREQTAREGAEQFALRMIESGAPLPIGERESVTGERENAAQRALLDALDALQSGDVADLALVAQDALEASSGADAREEIVDALTVLYRDLAGAARIDGTTAPRWQVVPRPDRSDRCADGCSSGGTLVRHDAAGHRVHGRAGGAGDDRTSSVERRIPTLMRAASDS